MSSGQNGGIADLRLETLQRVNQLSYPLTAISNMHRTMGYPKAFCMIDSTQKRFKGEWFFDVLLCVRAYCPRRMI